MSKIRDFLDRAYKVTGIQTVILDSLSDRVWLSKFHLWSFVDLARTLWWGLKKESNLQGNWAVPEISPVNPFWENKQELFIFRLLKVCDACVHFGSLSLLSAHWATRYLTRTLPDD